MLSKFSYNDVVSPRSEHGYQGLFQDFAQGGWRDKC